MRLKYGFPTPQLMPAYEVRPRNDRRGFDLISNQLPYGRLAYIAVTHAVDYAKFYSRSHPVIIRFFRRGRRPDRDAESAGDFKEWCYLLSRLSVSVSLSAARLIVSLALRNSSTLIWVTAPQFGQTNFGFVSRWGTGMSIDLSQPRQLIGSLASPKRFDSIL